MEFIRTSNAGGIIKLDNVSILIDGICDELFPYAGTPENIRKELENQTPDIVAYTHMHKDHYDGEYIKKFEKDNSGFVFGPEMSVSDFKYGVAIKGIETRHIGKENISHFSYIINGSKNILFMGDASPLDWKKISLEKNPDVIIAPFAYATTESSMRITLSFNPKLVILVHFPLYENDSFGIWDSAKNVIKDDDRVLIPEMGEKIFFE